jgi:hypothetical protein
MARPSASTVNWGHYYKDKWSINLVQNAYDACTQLDKWSYLESFTPIPGKMLIDDPVIDKIIKHMKMDVVHNYGSLVWTFAQILHFAKNGIVYP